MDAKPPLECSFFLGHMANTASIFEVLDLSSDRTPLLSQPIIGQKICVCRQDLGHCRRNAFPQRPFTEELYYRIAEPTLFVI